MKVFYVEFTADIVNLDDHLRQWLEWPWQRLCDGAYLHKKTETLFRSRAPPKVAGLFM